MQYIDVVIDNKSVNTDNYVTVSTTTWVGNPFSVRYSKVPTDYVDVEFDFRF